MCFFKSVKKITGILLHYMGAIMVCVLGHVHGAARESKYTKNRIHKCYNVTLLKVTVTNTSNIVNKEMVKGLSEHFRMKRLIITHSWPHQDKDQYNLSINNMIVTHKIHKLNNTLILYPVSLLPANLSLYSSMHCEYRLHGRMKCMIPKSFFNHSSQMWQIQMPKSPQILPYQCQCCHGCFKQLRQFLGKTKLMQKHVFSTVPLRRVTL